MNIAAPRTTITASLETITPAISQAYLDTMKLNRRLNDDRVDLYAKDILNDRWDSTTGESIKFNERGDLIDGQHRLNAVVEAGKAIQILVVRGCSEASQAVIDSGQARSSAQSLQLMGIEVNIREASIFRAMFSSIDKMTRRDISRSQVAELFPKYQESVRFSSVTHGSNFQSATQLRGLVARAYYCGVDPERLSRFLTIFDTGVSEHRTDAVVIAIRNHYLSNKKRSSTTDRAIAYSKYMYGLNLFLNHSTSNTLRLSKQQLWKIFDFDGEGKL